MGEKKKQTLSRSLLILITIKSHENSPEFQKTSDQLLSIIIHAIEIIDHMLDPTWIIMDIYICIIICPSIKNTYESTIYPSNNEYPQMI